MRFFLALWLVAGSQMLFGEEKSLEQLRPELINRHSFVVFSDQTTATVVVQEIKPSLLWLTILNTSDMDRHPTGKRQVAISSIRTLAYTPQEKLKPRVLRTAKASVRSAGKRAKCTWRSDSYAVEIGPDSTSQSPLQVSPFELPGCKP